jgi:hypothetical protein
MKLFVDSSAFTKRYVLEQGSDRLDQYLKKASQLALSTLLVPEIISGLNRRKREKVISLHNYRTIKKRLLEDVHDAIMIQVTPAVISRSIKLLEKNVLRAMDALHVACALEWQAELFVTADRRQLKAATNAGISTKYIGQRKADSHSTD